MMELVSESLSLRAFSMIHRTFDSFGKSAREVLSICAQPRQWWEAQVTPDMISFGGDTRIVPLYHHRVCKATEINAGVLEEAPSICRIYHGPVSQMRCWNSV